LPRVVARRALSGDRTQSISQSINQFIYGVNTSYDDYNRIKVKCSPYSIAPVSVGLSLSCCTYVFHRCRFVLAFSVLAYWSLTSLNITQMISDNETSSVIFWVSFIRGRRAGESISDGRRQVRGRSVCFGKKSDGSVAVWRHSCRRQRGPLRLL